MSLTTTVNSPATGVSHFPLLKVAKTLSDRHDRGWFAVSDILETIAGKNKATIAGQILDLIGAGLLELRPKSYPAQYRVTDRAAVIGDAAALEDWFWKVRGHDPNGFAALARERSVASHWRPIVYSHIPRDFLFAPGATYGDEGVLIVKRSEGRLWVKDRSGSVLIRKFRKPVNENCEVCDLNKSTRIKAIEYHLTGQKALMQIASKLGGDRSITARSILKVCDFHEGGPTANLVYTLSPDEVASLLDEAQGIPLADIWGHISRWEDTIV